MSKGKNKQVIKHFDNKDDLLKLNIEPKHTPRAY